MGTQGLSGRVGFGRRRDDRAWDGGVVHWRLNLIAALAILPIAAGCSLSPPWSSSANQTAAVPPPPNYPATATGQPAYTPPPGQQAYAPLAQPAYATPAATAAAAPPPAQRDYSELATLSEAVAYRRIPRLDANPSSGSDPRRNSSRDPRSTPIRPASAEYLHAFRSALLPAAGPTAQQRAAAGRDRRRGGSRQSRTHQLAAVPEAVALRGFLEQAISPASRRHSSI